MAPRFNIAVRHARRLLTRAAIECAPVPVDELAVLVGATIRRQPFDAGLSGMVHRGPEGPAVIGVNSSHPNTRQRFTIAHEIGHLLLHRAEGFHLDDRFVFGLRSERSSLAADAYEIEANQFAAELLMPEMFLRRDLGARELDPETDDTIGELAGRYGVSTQAMTIRLSRFGYLR